MRWLIISHLIKIRTVCHSILIFWLRPLLGTMVLTRFKDGRDHFRNLGVKGLKHLLQQQQTTFYFHIFWEKIRFGILCESSAHSPERPNLFFFFFFIYFFFIYLFFFIIIIIIIIIQLTISIKYMYRQNICYISICGKLTNVRLKSSTNDPFACVTYMFIIL